MTVVTALDPATQAGANDAGTGNDTSTHNTSQSRETEPSTKQVAPCPQSLTRQRDHRIVLGWFVRHGASLSDLLSLFPETTPERGVVLRAILEQEAARWGLPSASEQEMASLALMYSEWFSVPEMRDFAVLNPIFGKIADALELHAPDQTPAQRGLEP